MKFTFPNCLIKIILLLFICLVPLFLNIYPHYYAYKNTPENFVFSGQASWFDPWDLNTYVSAIKWGQEGNFLVPNLYTSTENKPVLIYFLYSFLGYCFRNINPFFLFHLAALVTGIFLCIEIIFLLNRLIKKRYDYYFILLSIFIGGGLGFILFPKHIFSADTEITGFTFTSLFQRPHEVISIGSYLMALLLSKIVLSENSTNKVKILISSFLISLTTLFHPYYLISFFIINFVYILVKNDKNFDKQLGKFISITIIPSITTTIYYFHLKSNQAYSSIIDQQLPRFSILAIMSGFGILLPFIIYYFIKIKKSSHLFLKVFFLTSLVMTFLPFGFSRFYLRGIYLPASIFAFEAIRVIIKKIKFNRLFLYIPVSILLFSTSIYIFYMRIVTVKNNNSWYYIHKDIDSGFKLLKENSKRNEAVLSFYTTGNMVPAFTGNLVYFGNNINTPNSASRRILASDFYSNLLPSPFLFLKENNISYIVVTSEEYNFIKNSLERGLKESIFDYPFLTEVYRSNNMIILKVNYDNK